MYFYSSKELTIDVIGYWGPNNLSHLVSVVFFEKVNYQEIDILIVTVSADGRRACQ